MTIEDLELEAMKGKVDCPVYRPDEVPRSYATFNTWWKRGYLVSSEADPVAFRLDYDGEVLSLYRARDVSILPDVDATNRRQIFAATMRRLRPLSNISKKKQRERNQLLVGLAASIEAGLMVEVYPDKFLFTREGVQRGAESTKRAFSQLGQGQSTSQFWEVEQSGQGEIAPKSLAANGDITPENSD